jgi:NADP-dependent aldehyde dehydrogenase
VVLQTTATELLRDVEALVEESFGPATLLVEYGSVDEALAVVRAAGGTLTATLHAEPGDDIDGVVAVLSDVAGRVLFAGWPTGVLVAWAQHHGGPWPSTTSLHSSVGPTAMRRFLRPISFQAAPERALPPALRDDNPLGIPRRVDGLLRLA